jgi:hypothetical protein
MIGDLRIIARALDGEVVGGQVLAPGPGHDRRDRSLSVKLSATSPDGFLCHSFSDNSWQDCRDHVRARLGIDRGRRPRETHRCPPEPRPQDDAQKARDLASARRIVSELVPIIGTPGERYLRDVRKIDVDKIRDELSRTDAIGWHPAVYFHQPADPARVSAASLLS